FKTFAAGSLFSIFMVAIYTRLGITPLWGLIGINVVLFISITARMVSSQALLSAIPSPDMRGAFMSVNASVAQISGGFASVIAGLIVVQKTGTSPIEHFDILGNAVVLATAITM